MLANTTRPSVAISVPEVEVILVELRRGEAPDRVPEFCELKLWSALQNYQNIDAHFVVLRNLHKQGTQARQRACLKRFRGLLRTSARPEVLHNIKQSLGY